MHMRRTGVCVTIAAATYLSACGPAQRSMSPSTTPLDTTVSTDLADATTTIEPSPKTTEVTPPALDPAAILGPALASLEAAEVRTRIPLPTSPVPFPEYAETVSYATQYTHAWVVHWDWAERQMHLLPDGTTSAGDLGVEAIVDPRRQGIPFEAPDDLGAELLRRGTWQFRGITTGCDPANPPTQDTTDGWAPSTGVAIVENDVLVATIVVWGSVIPCPMSGRTITPAELVDVLAGLIDCDVGGGQPTVCRELPPITDEDRARAIDLLSQWDLGRSDD